MRSDRVVLPESMCAEMPMLRMTSMFAFATSAFLKVPEKRGAATTKNRGEKSSFRQDSRPPAPVCLAAGPESDAGSDLSLLVNSRRDEDNPGRAAAHPGGRAAAWRAGIGPGIPGVQGPPCRADDPDRAAAAQGIPAPRVIEERLPLQGRPGARAAEAAGAPPSARLDRRRGE